MDNVRYNQQIHQHYTTPKPPSKAPLTTDLFFFSILYLAKGQRLTMNTDIIAMVRQLRRS